MFFFKKAIFVFQSVNLDFTAAPVPQSAVTVRTIFHAMRRRENVYTDAMVAGVATDATWVLPLYCSHLVI